MATKIKKTSTHDRMTFKATFDNGDDFTFNISRTRDSYGAGQLKATEKITQAEFEQITAWCKMRKDENHEQRHARAAEICSKARSLEALALLCSLEV